MKPLTNIAIVFAVVASGRATTGPPSELVDARSAYDKASYGPAGQLDPADLNTAKQTLDVAEQSFADDGRHPGNKGHRRCRAATV